jgi:hypothetical protein
MHMFSRGSHIHMSVCAQFWALGEILRQDILFYIATWYFIILAGNAGKNAKMVHKWPFFGFEIKSQEKIIFSNR